MWQVRLNNTVNKREREICICLLQEGVEWVHIETLSSSTLSLTNHKFRLIQTLCCSGTCIDSSLAEMMSLRILNLILAGRVETLAICSHNNLWRYSSWATTPLGGLCRTGLGYYSLNVSSWFNFAFAFI